MVSEVKKWLKSLGAYPSSDYLKIRLESHPEYPSLTAIQDTLTDFGFKSEAYSTDIENLKLVERPFLLHSLQNSVLYFPSFKSAQKSKINLEKFWSGVVMIAEEKNNTKVTVKDKLMAFSNQVDWFLVVTCACIMFALFSITFRYGTVTEAFLVFVNSIGFIASSLIVQKELGLSNDLSDKICKLSQNFNCNAVLVSKGSRLFKWLSLGDVGISYMTAVTIYLFIEILGGVTMFGFTLISYLAVPFILYSIFYQSQVVKHWCPLCIVILGVLGINVIFVTSFYPLSLDVSNKMGNSLGILFLLIVLSLTVWKMIRNLVSKSLIGLSSEIKVAHFKRNPEIFNAILAKQFLVEGTIPNDADPILVGSRHSKFRITIACSPFCRPCAAAHHELNRIADEFKEQVQIATRFVLARNGDSMKKESVVRKLVSSGLQQRHDLIDLWFRSFKEDVFENLGEEIKDQVDEKILNFINWTESVKVEATPTLFVNGKQLPSIYTWMDFLEILKISFKNQS